jgi:hypothetical protein
VTEQPQRLFGLDLVRAVAILLVLLAHGVLFPGNPLGWLPVPALRLSWISGVIGVELFYCLSGFLIGSLLVRIAANGIGWRSAWVFLLRRWMRTLPLYYLILGALVLVPALDRAPRPEVWRYALLVQNALTPMPESNWFGTSWSLVIEEWSYLAALALVALAARFTRRPVLFAGLALCCAGLVLRLLALRVGGDWDTTVRKMLLTRMDAIAPGIVLAWFWADRRQAVLDWARASLPATVPLLAISVWILSRQELLPTDYGRVLALPVLAAAMCMVLPVVIGLPAPPVIGPLVRWTARTSYALYLVHWSAMWVALAMVPPPWQYAVYVSASVSAAIVLSLAVEMPIMRLRPRQVRAEGVIVA